MKKEIMEKWVNALRSEEYKQGQGNLCDSKNRFCCLGVLTELFIQEKNKNTKNGKLKYGWEEKNGFLTFEGEELVLTNKVMKWSGMKTNSGIIKNNSLKDESLAIMNDKYFSFKDLANIIEEKYLEL